MTSNPLAQALKIFTSPVRWFASTPIRAVEEAYKAAVLIKKLEDDYFGGNEISETSGYSENAYSLFRAQLLKSLGIIDIRLAEYKVSCFIPYLLPKDAIAKVSKPLDKLDLTLDFNQNKPSILQQLAFIDFIIDRYRPQPQSQTSQQIEESKTEIIQLLDTKDLAPDPTSSNHHQKFSLFAPEPKSNEDVAKIVPVEKSILPGSFLRAVGRVKRNLSAYNSYEQDVVGELRQSRKRTNTAVTFVLVLIAATVISQQTSKIVVYSPLINHWSQGKQIDETFNPEFEEEAIQKFRLAREKIEFDRLVGLSPVLTEQEIEDSLRDEAINIVNFYKGKSLEGVKNLLADITASLVFYLILLSNKRQVRLVKEFIDETIYSLNDNAKAFILIATTDIFVGYHSSDGWDALLSTALRHFGLPENRVIILAFIATVPVFLDALIKFWVFQYLRSASPSTATIYKEMNE